MGVALRNNIKGEVWFKLLKGKIYNPIQKEDKQEELTDEKYIQIEPFS